MLTVAGDNLHQRVADRAPPLHHGLLVVLGFFVLVLVVVVLRVVQVELTRVGVELACLFVLELVFILDLVEQLHLILGKCLSRSAA